MGAAGGRAHGRWAYGAGRGPRGRGRAVGARVLLGRKAARGAVGARRYPTSDATLMAVTTTPVATSSAFVRRELA
jgi:hypothetical protein